MTEDRWKYDEIIPEHHLYDKTDIVNNLLLCFCIFLSRVVSVVGVSCVFHVHDSPLHHSCVISVHVNTVDVDMAGAILYYKMVKYEIDCQYNLNKTQEKTRHGYPDIYLD